MTNLYLIVGLGNPGPRYAPTRHNIGFQTLDRLAGRQRLSFARMEHKAQVASGTVFGQRVLLAKPQTFMNASGDSIGPLAHFYKIPPECIIIVCDDLDIPLGTVRIRAEGSSGGQNGLKHILQRLGTQSIARVRLGIGRPPGRMDPADYVLTPFRGDEEILALEVQDRAIQALETWLTDGIALAMSRWSGPVESLRPARAPRPAPAGPDEGSAG
jgi:PTH1 family peptidyl-tRNA hydrolase